MINDKSKDKIKLVRYKNKIIKYRHQHKMNNEEKTCYTSNE